jgi:hypothetical protein
LPTGAVGRLIDPTYRNPYSEQFNGGYSWQITSDSVIEAEYVLHESKSIVVNPQINGVRATSAPFAALGLPVLGEIQDYDSIGRSRYDAMNLSYRKRLTRHFSINASYVLSRGLAYNGTAAGFGNGPTDELNWFAKHDFGPTPQDETHRITISGLFNLPFGITASPIMQWATGRPYTSVEGISDVYGFGGGQGTTHTIVLNSVRLTCWEPRVTPMVNCWPVWRPALASRSPTATFAAKIFSNSTHVSADSSSSARK